MTWLNVLYVWLTLMAMPFVIVIGAAIVFLFGITALVPFILISKYIDRKWKEYR